MGIMPEPTCLLGESIDDMRDLSGFEPVIENAQYCSDDLVDMLEFVVSFQLLAHRLAEIGFVGSLQRRDRGMLALVIDAANECGQLGTEMSDKLGGKAVAHRMQCRAQPGRAPRTRTRPPRR